ncbi:hypothetical protein BS50DRAFT_674943 [Corynespora cassiicola Philippines]|uniref:Uncharacterized protein n=1 Tax=Corynespora cassiicola Philippines TaxID=1448308 RepID=A0A2T2NSY4_CORCC|nr:hypothetical protein BS50DRAFT_674943 [Corynespora cassiicola Philippines]
MSYTNPQNAPDAINCYLPQVPGSSQPKHTAEPAKLPQPQLNLAYHPSLLSPRTEFLLDWSLKILGVLAAVLFGIWAPISYNATAEGNDKNDAAQTELVEKLDAMSSQASLAANAQSAVLEEQASLASEMASVKSRIQELAVLRAWEFCDGRAREIDACSELTASVTIGDIITGLASSETATTTFRTSSNLLPSATSSHFPSSGSAPGATKLSLPVILGIVFGSLAVFGIAMGLLVWRNKEAKLKRYEALARNEPHY